MPKTHIAGQYSLKELIITSFKSTIDIRNLFVELNIYEDIFSHVMSGYIVLQESVNLQETLPIIGEETLRIKFTSSDNGNFKIFNKTFNIFKISDVLFSGDKVKSYALHFISPEFNINMNRRIRRSYNNFPQEIVKNIFTETMGLNKDTLFLESAKHTKNIVIPNWTPFKTIDYLCQTSISEAFNSPSYVFYENTDGFFFVTLDYLMSKKSNQTITYEENNINVLNYTMSQAEQYVLDKSFDTIENSRNGMYGSRLITHDIIKKKIEVFDYDYNKDFDKTQHIDDKPDKFTHSRENQQKNLLMLFPKNYANEFVNEWMQLRKSKIRQFDNYITTIVMPGNTNQTVGNKVIFDVPSTKSSDKKSKDLYLAGNYLITKIRHKIEQQEYSMTLELRKDSFKAG